MSEWSVATCPDCGEPMHIAPAKCPAGSLDAAWAEAEVALPKGWELSGVERWYTPHEWIALAHEPGHSEASAGGPTPAAARRALAAKLRGEV